MKKILLAEKTGRPSRLQIQDYAAEMSKKYNVPLEIVLRHLWIESAYNINARSSVDAFGLMQLMPGTAQAVGVDREDWRQNIEGGTQYLSRMYKTYNGKTPYPWVVASMAYFTGPGNIDKTLRAANKLNMEIVDYVIMKKNQKSQYHTSIHNYANAIYDNNHRRNKRRPPIETTLAPKGINVNIHPGVADVAQSMTVSPKARVAAAAAQTQQPKAAPRPNAPVISSKKVKKISHLSKTQRPTIKIQTNEQGKALISYDGSDPLGKGLNFQPRDLDKEVNRLFGYASWNDYIEDNKEDLSAKTQTDDKGNVLSGPTVHPIHVAYALEEFAKTASPDDYTLIGVPKGAASKNIIAVQAISGLRRGLFGDSKGTVSLSRLGILNSAMYGPLEGLQNVSTIEKAKKASGVAKINSDITTTVMPVEHPDGGFWNKTFSPQTTDSKESALAYAPSETGAPVQMLSEFVVPALSALLRGVVGGAKALGRLMKGAPKDAKSVTQTMAKRPGGGTTIDQLTKAASKDTKRLYKNGHSDASVERALRRQMSGRLNPNAIDDVVDGAMAYGRRKGLDDAARAARLAARGGSAARGASGGGGVIGATKKAYKAIVYGSTLAGGAGGAYGAYKAMESDASFSELSDQEKFQMIMGLSVGAFLGGKVGKYGGHILAFAIMVAIPADLMYQLLSEKEGDFNRRVEQYRELIFDVTTQAAELAGVPSSVDEIKQIFQTADTNEQSQQYATRITQQLQNQTSIAATGTASNEGDLQFYLVPKNWRSGVYYTDAEGILAQRVGANLKAGLIVTDQGEQTKEQFLNWAAASLKATGIKKPSGQQKQFTGGKAEKTNVSSGDVLIFGHSQSGPTALGGALEKKLKSRGLEVTRITINGASDNSLADRLKKIPVKNYKQAYLFLNGNVYKAGGDLMESAKARIINHMSNALKIPSGNILVILPPVNRNSEKSMRRYDLSKRAVAFFASRNVNVANIIVADGKSFKDDIHIKGSAPEAQSSIANIVSGLSVKVGSTQPGPVAAVKQAGSDPEYAYTFGGLAAGTPIYSSHNENRITGHGASMNKPILALIHMMMYKQAPQKLTDQELRAMLAYTGGESNTISKLASGVNRKYSARRDAERKKTIGTVSDADAARFLSKLGLDSSMRIRWNNNKQTPKQFFDFMRLIHNKQKISSLGIENEINKILSYMRRDKNLGVSIGGDRESKRWPVLLKAIQDKGLQVSKIYGKGGLVASGFHYALVIDDKYLLTMYSKRPVKGKGQKKHINWFSNKVAEILATVVPRTKAKTNENLLAYKPLIARAIK